MSGLQQAVDKLGSQAELAAAIGLKQQNIWNWLNRGSGEAPPEHCSAIERATGGAVMRWHLRRDPTILIETATFEMVTQTTRRADDDMDASVRRMAEKWLAR